MSDSSIIGQLYQRKMFRIGAGYLAVAWLLWQIVGNTCPAFECSLESQRTIFWLLLGGLPITLAVAWVNWKTAIIVGVAFIAGAGVSVLIMGSQPLPAVPIVEEVEQELLPNSVAVLPLDNLSLDPEDAFFAAGIHEEILNQLVKLSNLNVISRTSMVRYADSDLSIPEIAAELNVGAVMEGSVRYADGRVLVTLQLIDPEIDVHLWSETYNREFADIFAMQADIAMNVANALQAEFSLAEQQEIESVPTDSPEAYSLYLKALSLGFGTRVIDTVTEYLDAAIRLDPNFALAYARKAVLHATLLNGNVPGLQTEYERIAQENAEQALALDNTLGGMHGVLAFVHQVHWRWDEAEQEWAEAIRLYPNNSNTLAAYSRTKIYRGDYDEAIESAQRAAELNPRNSAVYYYLGISHLYATNHDAAAESFRRALELVPADGNLHLRLGITEGIRGNWEIAVSELQIAEQLYGEDIQTQRFSMLANGYAHIEQRDDVERLFNAQKARAENSPVNAALWAWMYIALEEFDQALEWLEVAVENEAPDLVILGAIKANPYAIAVLDEPRFKELRDRIGQ